MRSLIRYIIKMQASVPKLASLVGDDGVNVVEFYSCPAYIENIANEHMINLVWDKLPNFFPKDNPQEETQFYHRDLCYIFDVGNDAQRCLRRTLRSETYYRNFYVASFQEEAIPSHRFPSTTDLSATVQVIKYTQRINNRITWVYERGANGELTTYVRYNHAPNVDLDTMQKDLETTLARMPKPISKQSRIIPALAG